MVIITGSSPPDACGVGDYSKSLFQALTSQRIPASIYYRKRWSLSDLRNHVKEIMDFDDPILNLQYPTEGYGYSVVPQLLTFLLRKKFKIVTLHEFTRKSLKGRIAIFLFFLSADWIVFTTNEEHGAACLVAPWIRKRSSIIQIASSIPMQDAASPESDLAYFGLIRPEKGLEQFCEIVSRVRKERPIKVRVIGQLVSGYESYSEEILRRLKSEGAELILNKNAEEVSNLLSRTRVVLLPFPDGMSPRRSSALAAMGNGALLVTTPPPAQFADLRSHCVSATDTATLAGAIQSAIDHPENYEETRKSGQAFARNIQWPNIAQQYQGIANKLVKL